jgi:outer membrane lipoprotein-sorting protein
MITLHLIAAAGLCSMVASGAELDEILRQMDQHERAMSASLEGYTCVRRYALVNQRFHKKAELSVRMTYVAPGHKTFKVLSEAGSAILRQKVLRPMLDAETEAGQDDIRPLTRIVGSNYEFKLLEEQVQQGRRAYVLEVSPKTRNKFLIRGRVWVDEEDYGIIRVEAGPAQNPSIFIRDTRIVQQSSRYGEIWLPLFNRSNTDSLLFGHTEVTIDSSDYKISEVSSPSQTSAAERR